MDPTSINRQLKKTVVTKSHNTDELICSMLKSFLGYREWSLIRVAGLSFVEVGRNFKKLNNK